MAFSRKACGPDFLDAVVDGRLRISFLDEPSIYEAVGSFKRDEGKLSSVGFSYRLKEIVENDMPFRKKKGVIEKNMKKDQLFITYDGHQNVNFKTNVEDCLLKGAIGVLPDGKYPESMTACVTKDKNFY